MVTVALVNPTNANTAQHWLRVTCMAYQHSVWPQHTHEFALVTQIDESYRGASLTFERFPTYLGRLNLPFAEWQVAGIWVAKPEEVPPWPR